MSYIDGYVPTDTWIRNYRAMGTEKIIACLSDFRWTVDRGGFITPAVERVMEHGGDIYENYERLKDEARRRGLTVL